jgi:Lar family restriction alleviation protein
MKLKTCPFCGGKKIRIIKRTYVVCFSCYADIGLNRDKEKAIKKWNRRVKG